MNELPKNFCILIFQYSLSIITIGELSPNHKQRDLMRLQGAIEGAKAIGYSEKVISAELKKAQEKATAVKAKHKANSAAIREK